MMVTGGNVTGIVDPLEQQGLVERAAEPSDRRAFRVRLTRAGRKAFAEMARARRLDRRAACRAAAQGAGGHLPPAGENEAGHAGGEIMMQILQPPGWAKPRGFSNGIAAAGRLVFVAGQIGWTGENKWEAKDFAGQFRQTLKNTLAVLAEAGAKPEHIARMTWYIVDKREYLDAMKEVGAAYRELIGRHYPAMAVVQVGALMEDEAKVEIETTAVIP